MAQKNSENVSLINHFNISSIQEGGGISRNSLSVYKSVEDVLKEIEINKKNINE